jgi:hypothetical protein
VDEAEVVEHLVAGVACVVDHAFEVGRREAGIVGAGEVPAFAERVVAQAFFDRAAAVADDADTAQVVGVEVIRRRADDGVGKICLP